MITHNMLPLVGDDGPELVTFPKGVSIYDPYPVTDIRWNVTTGKVTVMQPGQTVRMLPPTPDGLRLMLLITSNAYEDRVGEIIKQKALEGYVDSCWKDDEYIGRNPLLVWHGGDPVGEIIYADMEGPFLIEVAKELPDHEVNLALEGETPLLTTVKTAWDAMATYADSGASHKFYHPAGDEIDKAYDRILKVESSWLPTWAAANYMTDAQVIGGH